MAPSSLPFNGCRIPDASEYPFLEVDNGFRGVSQRPPTGSSILEESAIEEYGRTFHSYKADTYPLPNDGEEQDRLDMQHKIATLLLDGHLYWAPIHNPRNVLDIATGTGIWALEFAKQHPESQVTGSDLSEIQPRDMASNCQFIREDVDNDEWTYNCTFDYIHVRFFCVFSTDIQALIRNIYNHLDPNGWVEFQEATYQGTLNEDENSAVDTALGYVTRMMAAAGRQPWVMTVLKDLLVEAGFVDVQQYIQPMPVNEWPADPKYKEIGRWNARNALAGLDSLTKSIVRSGRTIEDAQGIVRRAQEEVQSGEKRLSSLFYVVSGRKPM